MDAITKGLVSKLVDDLALRRYADIVLDGRAGRLTAQEMERVIREYGRTLVPLPDAAWSLVEEYEVDGGGTSLDVPLWTLEEGRGDLTLSVTLGCDGVDIQIDDLHVL